MMKHLMTGKTAIKDEQRKTEKIGKSKKQKHARSLQDQCISLQTMSLERWKCLGILIRLCLKRYALDRE